MTSRTSRAGLWILWASCLGLTACAPQHLLIEQASLASIESRLEQMDGRLMALSERQVNPESLLEAQQAQQDNLRRMSEDLQRLAKVRVCPPQPKPQCPADGAVQSAQAQAAAGPSAATAAADPLNGKQLVGAVEDVLIQPHGLLAPARIDTGATTASLHAVNLRFFERDGADWVRFVLPHPEAGDVEMESKVVRYVRIIQSTTDQGERRPVIELHFILGNISQTAEFTLTDRGHLEYPVLIGRNILQDLMVVDVARSRIAPPNVDLTQ